MLSPSSFSAWASFITSGNIFVDTKCKIYRENLFKNIEILPNFNVFNTSEDFINILNNIK